MLDRDAAVDGVLLDRVLLARDVVDVEHLAHGVGRDSEVLGGHEVPFQKKLTAARR
ncbi:hypothetical protein GS489_07640 [Rhodococcus hoagii]|nr:hypothetical protein [Prescottella equi]